MSLWGPGYRRLNDSSIVIATNDVVNTEISQTRDVYRGSSQIGSDNEYPELRPVRMPCITTQSSRGSVLLQPGLYKFLVVGKRTGGTPFNVDLVTMTPPVTIRRLSVKTPEFDFTTISMLPQETELELGIQRERGVGAINLNVEVTLVIERL